ncbi:MAG: glycosyltransferase family 10 domain-containing protein [Chloroflexota bacterium]
MNKPKIKIFFTDFWPKFKLEDNWLLDWLKPRYDVEITDKPDFLFYSVFGNNFRRFDCTRIIYIGENIRPNFKECDWSFSFDYDAYGGRNFRLPHYALYFEPERLIKSAGYAEANLEKKKFCNFVYSNPGCRARNKFFKELSKYKKVDSGGKLYNNIGGRVGDKTAFLNEYKFTIAFENFSAKGYTTEKICEPMLVGSIPIYWGNPLIGEEFNVNSFVNSHDFESMEAVIERVIELDRDEGKRGAMLSEPWFVGNRPNQFVDRDRLYDQFDRIFADEREPVARRSFAARGSALRPLSLAVSDATFEARRFGKKIINFKPYKLKIKYDSWKRKI